MESQRDAVRELIREQLCRDPDEMRDDANLTDDLGADCLDLVELAMYAEDRFGIEIPDDELPTLQRVGDWCDFVERKTREA